MKMKLNLAKKISDKIRNKISSEKEKKGVDLEGIAKKLFQRSLENEKELKQELNN